MICERTDLTRPDRLGLVAGNGDFPGLIAKAARSNGVHVVIFGISGFASPALSECADVFHWVELGQVSKTIELMHREGVRHITMAGRVPHNSIFQYRHFDARAMKIVAKALSRRADHLLQTVIDDLETEGLTVVDSSMFLKSLMPTPGLVTPDRPLSSSEQEDAEFGFPIAKVVAGQDIGQTIVVKDKLVVAVEGVEGTDECILRAGKLAGAGCTVIKVCKPNQDLRFDIPVIGPGTIESMAKAGATAIVVSAGRSLLFHRECVVDLAEQHGIAIAAVQDADISQKLK